MSFARTIDKKSSKDKWQINGEGETNENQERNEVLVISTSFQLWSKQDMWTTGYGMFEWRARAETVHPSTAN